MEEAKMNWMDRIGILTCVAAWLSCLLAIGLIASFLITAFFRLVLR